MVVCGAVGGVGVEGGLFGVERSCEHYAENMVDFLF